MTDSKEPRYIDAGRRVFMQGAAVTGVTAATGATALAGDVMSADVDPLEQPGSKVGESGYQRTEHVQKYYKRARF